MQFLENIGGAAIILQRDLFELLGEHGFSGSQKHLDDPQAGDTQLFLNQRTIEIDRDLGLAGSGGQGAVLNAT